MTMNATEKKAIRAVIKALSVPRDRFGRLDPSTNGTFAQSGDAMREFAVSLKLPHGGQDRIDQATMILQAIVGDPICSIMDKAAR